VMLPLCPPANASPFWIMLLPVQDGSIVTKTSHDIRSGFRDAATIASAEFPVLTLPTPEGIEFQVRF
jgi:hypothetical protein